MAVNKVPNKIKYALRFLPDKMYIQLYFFAKFKKLCNLKNPRAFNEKIQWLKLYDRNPEYIKMVDKYEVKKYVADIIGEEYIIPTLSVWDSFDEINFNALPEQFVLKCTHDSGGGVICKDKSEFDWAKAKEIIEKSLEMNFYWIGREWPYKYVKPRIIAEKYLSDESENELKDYKFMCFNGQMRCSFVCSDRFSEEGLHVTFFDRDWNRLPFTRSFPASEKEIEKPEQYEKMVEIAEELSKDIPFVRVDLYETCRKIYFGELTFYPGNGMGKFNPESWDIELGSWIKLPNNESIDI